MASKLGIELLTLTAARSGEVRGACWSEIDGDAWTIPAERMKAKVAHRVPLSSRGAEVASALLVAAGDNPERMRSEASFAALCGASPIEASSGPRVRHRLNRGGNR